MPQVIRPSRAQTIQLSGGGELTPGGEAATPEPSTWVLLLGGLGGLAVAQLRRKRPTEV